MKKKHWWIISKINCKTPAGRGGAHRQRPARQQSTAGTGRSAGTGPRHKGGTGPPGRGGEPGAGAGRPQPRHDPQRVPAKGKRYTG